MVVYWKMNDYQKKNKTKQKLISKIILIKFIIIEQWGGVFINKKQAFDQTWWLYMCRHSDVSIDCLIISIFCMIIYGMVLIFLGHTKNNICRIFVIIWCDNFVLFFFVFVRINSDKPDVQHSVDSYYLEFQLDNIMIMMMMTSGFFLIYKTIWDLL